MPELRKRIYGYIDVAHRGIELGPSYNPVVPKRGGYNVKIVDHAPVEVLREKFAHNPHIDLDAIEPVDIVWENGRLEDAFPENELGLYDYAVACHVIEHMPDMLAFLQSCEKLLCRGGLLILMIPDKRFCFDFCQSLSDTAEILENHASALGRHSAKAHFRHATKMVLADQEIGWNAEAVTSYGFAGYPRSVLATAAATASAEHYIDTHSQYFTPSSFHLIIEELRYLEQIKFEVICCTEPEGPEFLVVLKMSDRPPAGEDQIARTRRLLETGIMNELAGQLFHFQQSKPWKEALAELKTLRPGLKTYGVFRSNPAIVLIKDWNRLAHQIRSRMRRGKRFAAIALKWVFKKGQGAILARRP